MAGDHGFATGAAAVCVLASSCVPAASPAGGHGRQVPRPRTGSSAAPRPPPARRRATRIPPAGRPRPRARGRQRPARSASPAAPGGPAPGGRAHGRGPAALYSHPLGAGPGGGRPSSARSWPGPASPARPARRAPAPERPARPRSCITSVAACGRPSHHRRLRPAPVPCSTTPRPGGSPPWPSSATRAGHAAGGQAGARARPAPLRRARTGPGHPGAFGPARWRQFLDRRLAASPGRRRDGIELPGESLEKETRATTRRSSAAAAARRQAKPGSRCWPGCPRPAGAPVASCSGQGDRGPPNRRGGATGSTSPPQRTQPRLSRHQGLRRRPHAAGDSLSSTRPAHREPGAGPARPSPEACACRLDGTEAGMRGNIGARGCPGSRSWPPSPPDPDRAGRVRQRARGAERFRAGQRRPRRRRGHPAVRRRAAGWTRSGCGSPRPGPCDAPARGDDHGRAPGPGPGRARCARCRRCPAGCTARPPWAARCCWTSRPRAARTRRCASRTQGAPPSPGSARRQWSWSSRPGRVLERGGRREGSAGPGHYPSSVPTSDPGPASPPPQPGTDRDGSSPLPSRSVPHRYRCWNRPLARGRGSACCRC